jgi:hypothetical protein
LEDVAADADQFRANRIIPLKSSRMLMMRLNVSDEIDE